MCDGRLPRAADLQPPRRCGCCASAPRRVRRRPRQPGARLRPCSSIEEAIGLPLVTTIHHPISFDRRIDLAAATTVAQALTAAPLVRLRPDAGAGGPAGPRMVLTPSESSRRDIVARVRRRRRPGCRSSCSASTTASCRRREPRVPGPDPGDGQRRRPDEGHRDPAGGLRQAAHRAPDARAGAGHQARAGRPDRAAARRARRSATTCAFVHGVTDAELVDADGVGRAGLRARASTRASRCPTAELMATAHPAGRLAGRRDPRGGRPRRALRRPGHPGRRRRAGRGPRRAARRPRAAGPLRRGRARAGSRSCSAGGPSAAATAAAYEDGDRSELQARGGRTC